VFGEFVRTAACPECGGRGEIVEHPCESCSGAGRILEERKLEVQVPAGIHDGQRIRLSGEGHAGALGGRAGDVYVLVRVRPDPRFVREGNDVFSQADLTIVQAALGTTLTVETIDGPVELEFEPGTQPGQVRVLRGRGMPVLQGFGRGDHRVLVNVSVPRRLTDEQRRLLEEFERGSDDDTYRHDEGFFDKLKSAFR
jgi:molecular chaperone DnaJ